MQELAHASGCQAAVHYRWLLVFCLVRAACSENPRKGSEATVWSQSRMADGGSFPWGPQNADGEQTAWLDLPLRILAGSEAEEGSFEDFGAELDRLGTANGTLSNETLKDLEEVDEELEDLGTTISVMLLGMVGFVMVVFYLVNCRSSLIRENTWYVINSTLSIFCSVLFFQATHSAALALQGYSEEDITEPLVIFDMLCFLVTWFSLSWALHFLRPCHDEMKAVGMMGAHVTGFVAMYAFGEWQQLESVKTSLLACTGVVGAFVFITLVLCVLSRLMRPSFSSSMHELIEGSSSEDEVPEGTWIDFCIETEDDVIALCLGFLISQLVRFQITGSLPPINGQPDGHDYAQILSLFLAGVGFQILAGASTYFVHVSRHPRNNSLRLELWTRYATLFQDIVAMSMAWCTLMCGQWLFYRAFRIERVLGRLLLALVASARAVVFVFILEVFFARVPVIRKSSWRAVVDAEALLVGLTWESTFDAAVEGLGEDFTDPVLAKCCISCGLIAIVWPAWRFYILPRSLERPSASIMSRSKSGSSSLSGDMDRMEFLAVEQSVGSDAE